MANSSSSSSSELTYLFKPVENKVPCGGFVTGAGLKVENGKVSVNGGVETWIWCNMTPQTSDTSADLGYCYINKIRVTDADYNEL